MTQEEVRLACLRLAVDTTGNSNKEPLAREYEKFVTEQRAPEKKEKTK